MENQVNIKAVKELEQLKKQQEKLEATIKAQEKLAKNDIKKTEAIEEARISLSNRVSNRKKRFLLETSFSKALTNFNSKVKVRVYEDDLSITPTVYIYEEGVEFSQRWQGKPLTEKIMKLEITYRGIKIDLVDSSSRHSSIEIVAELPYSVEDSRRKLKNPKTILTKIDDYFERVAYQKEKVTQEELSYQKAKEYLMSICPVEAVIFTYEDKQNGLYDGYMNSNHLIIDFANGNSAKYRVNRTSEENKDFTLSLEKFFDLRLIEIKKNPLTVINHLK